MTDTPEFSRPIAVEGLVPDKIRKEAIEATEEERAALARRFDLRALESLKAKMNIRRVAGGATVRVQGDFEAEVIQACAVSLRDVSSEIRGTFDTFFTETGGAAGAEVELSLDDDEDSAERLKNGMIDLGEVVAQSLSLELDPFVRAPGVSLAAQMAETGTQEKNSPFRLLHTVTPADSPAGPPPKKKKKKR